VFFEDLVVLIDLCYVSVGYTNTVATTQCVNVFKRIYLSVLRNWFSFFVTYIFSFFCLFTFFLFYWLTHFTLSWVSLTSSLYAILILFTFHDRTTRASMKNGRFKLIDWLIDWLIDLRFYLLVQFSLALTYLIYFMVGSILSQTCRYYFNFSCRSSCL